MSESPSITPARGQLWRRKRDGRLVRIEGAKNTGSESRPYYDIIWCTETKPHRRGACFEDYWFPNYELVDSPGESPTVASTVSGPAL